MNKKKVRTVPETPVSYNNDSGIILGSDKVTQANGMTVILFKSVGEPVTLFAVTVFDQVKHPNKKPRIAFDPSILRQPSDLEIELSMAICEELFPDCFLFPETPVQ